MKIRKDRKVQGVCSLLFAAVCLLGPVPQGNAAALEPPPVSANGPGGDFLPQARLLSRLATCAEGVETPPGWSKEVLERHCALLRAQVSKYRTRWIERAKPLLARLVPANVPQTVVYPFGGGDLVTALATFPEAKEFTTISLEPAGDVRALDSLGGQELQDGLDTTRDHLRCLFAVSHSKTTNLRIGSRSALPGEIAFALVALDIFDYEPISLHYFRLDEEGRPVYLQASELGPIPAPSFKDTSQSPVANVEIFFRLRNNPSAPLRVYRHLAANLDDTHFAANQRLALHLAAKGRVSVLVKAASYLLWFDNFSHIRSYLLDHADFMISDSTGVPPSLARAAGFEQECYGQFHGPFLAKNSHTKEEFLALWQAGPPRPLPFLFGYPDDDGHGHLMVNRRASKKTAPPSAPLVSAQVSGGTHWRLLTAKGPIHVWQPRGYSAGTAGTVLYVHGYYTNVDNAWKEHTLAEQFAASKVNALFIVPEAPNNGEAEVLWPVLADLLSAVEGQMPGTLPQGPIVVAGHSGAWRTIGGWTDEPRIETFLLLDALYGQEDRFQDWLTRHPGNAAPRLTLVTKDTMGRTSTFLAGIKAAKRRDSLPESYRDLTAGERSAAVLEIHPDLGHMEIIVGGKALPILLRRSPLKPLKTPVAPASPEVKKPDPVPPT